ncbi:DPP IV N-terminal domain-containing protein [bacterium]|nr:DPP IV N-terminal domain-containing protein [bacterium]
MGKQYCLVDAHQKTTVSAFDHQALALTLTEQLKQHVDPENLPISDIEFDDTATVLRFSAYEKKWSFDTKSGQCREIKPLEKNWKISPDGKQAAFIKDYNIWIHDFTTGKDLPLTSDGSAQYVYGCMPTVLGNIPASKLQSMPVLDFQWSPDSTQLLSQVIDTGLVAVGMPLVEHVPLDGSLRPRIHNPERRVACFGDEQIEAWQILCIHVQSGDIHRLGGEACPITYPHYNGYFSGGRGWWDADSRQAYLIYQQENGEQTQLLKWDIHAGNVEVLFDEMPGNSATIIPATHMQPLSIPLPDSDELIWYSERSGWAHLYLYTLSTGELKNAITAGDWCVRNVLHYDTTERILTIQTAGRVEGRNPYYRDICRVNIDTGKLVSLCSTEHEYVVADHKSYMPDVNDSTEGVSPSGRYVVATRSRVDDLPVSVLLDRKGQEIMILETADVSGMPPNWQWPEPLLIKGADGKTDIVGTLFRPSDFSPEKKYPVLDLSYVSLGLVGSFSNNATGHYHYLASMAYAELGFIVVRFEHRGDAEQRGAGLRSRAFFEQRDSSLPSHNMADCVAGIKQLCNRYDYMDSNRVGVADYIACPAALTGLLVYPEIYKVGVSLNPMIGGALLPMNLGKSSEFPSHELFAENLRGKLLLMHGMLEDAIPVSVTFRIIDALQKANKPFDMLLLPNVGHHGSDYTMRRGWDYLVTHLLGEEPPINIKPTKLTFES